MEELQRKIIELNLRLLKRLATEDVDMLKEIITLETKYKNMSGNMIISSETRHEAPEVS